MNRYIEICSGRYVQNDLSAAVPTDPSTNPVEQPIDLFPNGLAHKTFVHVGVTTRPVTHWPVRCSNRPQGGIITPAKTAPKSHPRLDPFHLGHPTDLAIKAIPHNMPNDLLSRAEDSASP